MKKILSLILLLLIIVLNASAQLANWTPGSNPVNTNFPVNNVGQINGFCRISQLKFHPTNQNKMYAVTGQGGLFTTIDGGNNWTVSAGTDNIVDGAASVCVDYTNDQVIYVSGGDADYYSNGGGIYKSTNGGASFTLTSLTDCMAHNILQDPSNPGTFVAATNKGIYKTINSGVTWTATTATTIPFTDLKENAVLSSPILYTCTNEFPSRFYRSPDFGSTWTQITSGLNAVTTRNDAGGRIGVTPADPNVVYFEAIAGGGIIYKSNDGGLNFTLKKGEASPYIVLYDGVLLTEYAQANYNNSIWVDVSNPAKIWLQSHREWISTDSGATWTNPFPWYSILHTDMHQVQQSPFNSSELWGTNDGGIWLSTDGGSNWTPKSNGLYAYEIGDNTGKSSHTNRDYTIIGTQDNGKLYRDATGWHCIGGGDDYEPKEYDYLPSGGYIYNKGGDTRTAAPGGAYSTYGLPTANIQEIAFNRTNTEVAFMGNGNVYRTTNLSAATPTWIQISTFSTPIRAMHSSIADINRLYVITDDQKMYVSSNAMSGSPTFTQYSLPATAYGSYLGKTSIAAIANNANTVYVTLNEKVFVSTNAGANWTDISYNLPPVIHAKILAEEYGGTQELVFVATNNAVYYKKAGQVTWTNYSTNLPGRRGPTDFSMFDDGTNQSLIRYTSYGRGMWETPFSNLRAPLTFIITANAGANGSISPAGAVNVTSGNNQTFTITPNPCYRIANVWVDGVSQGGIPTYTFTNVTANHTIVATFAQLSYILSATAGPGGSISPTATIINCGGNQTFNITANSCNQIANVIVDGVSQGAIPSYTFTNVTANHTISATFTPFTYTITATAGPGGSITPSGAIVVNCGTNKTFTITPNPGFAVQNVLVDAASQGAITTYTFYNVTTAHTISASFIATCTMPAAAGSISGPPKVCKNQTGLVYTVGTIANATSYVWTLPAGMSPVSGGLTTTGNTITVKTNNTFTGGSITVKGSNTCGFGTSSPSFVVSLFTSAPSTPTAINNLTGTAYGYCQGNTYTFTTTATDATSFNWTISCGTILNGQGTNTVFVQIGYSCSSCKIEVKAINCIGSSTKRELYLESVLPTPSISGPSYVCKNTNPVATYTVTCADGATSFTWSSSTSTVKFSTGGTPINPFTTTSTSVTVNFAGVVTGTRNVQVRANNSCGSSEKETKNVTVAVCNAPVTRSAQDIKEESIEIDVNNFKVFPNPTHDEMNISMYSKTTTRYSLKLINSAGQVVLSETKFAVAGTNNYRISMASLAGGLYQVILQSGETIMQTKIVKE